MNKTTIEKKIEALEAELQNSTTAKELNRLKIQQEINSKLSVGQKNSNAKFFMSINGIDIYTRNEWVDCALLCKALGIEYEKHRELIKRVSGVHSMSSYLDARDSTMLLSLDEAYIYLSLVNHPAPEIAEIKRKLRELVSVFLTEN